MEVTSVYFGRWNAFPAFVVYLHYLTGHVHNCSSAVVELLLRWIIFLRNISIGGSIDGQCAAAFDGFVSQHGVTTVLYLVSESVVLLNPLYMAVSVSATFILHVVKWSQ